LSADMSHSVHPNYASKHDPKHSVQINGGVVLKFNRNQRYATNSDSAYVIRNMAEKAKINIQDFCSNNEVSCGTTIGPIFSTKCNIPSADIGCPMLAMHSIRETCGLLDIVQYIKLMSEFYKL